MARSKYLTVDVIREIAIAEVEQVGSITVSKLMKAIEGDVREALMDKSFQIRYDFFLASLVYTDSPFIITGNIITLSRKHHKTLTKA